MADPTRQLTMMVNVETNLDTLTESIRKSESQLGNLMKSLKVMAESAGQIELGTLISVQQLAATTDMANSLSSMTTVLEPLGELPESFERMASSMNKLGTTMTSLNSTVAIWARTLPKVSRALEEADEKARDLATSAASIEVDSSGNVVGNLKKLELAAEEAVSTYKGALGEMRAMDTGADPAEYGAAMEKLEALSEAADKAVNIHEEALDKITTAAVEPAVIGAAEKKLDSVAESADKVKSMHEETMDSVTTSAGAIVYGDPRELVALRERFTEIKASYEGSNEELENMKELFKDITNRAADKQLDKLNESFSEKKGLEGKIKKTNDQLERQDKEFKRGGKAAKAFGDSTNKMFGTQNEQIATQMVSRGKLNASILNTKKGTISMFIAGVKGATAFKAALGPIGWILIAIQVAIKVITVAFKVLKTVVTIQAKIIGAAIKAMTKTIAIMGKTIWTIVKGPLAMMGKALKYVAALFGGLSLVDAIGQAVELEASVNDIARTMVGGVESSKDFARAQADLMRDVKNSAWEAGASAKEMVDVYAGLASMHIPVKDLKGLADMSYAAAKGLGMSVDQATQLVGELTHIGKLGETEIKSILGQFAMMQQSLGLSAAETQTLTKALIETTRRLRAMGASRRMIQRLSTETNKLAAAFIKAGLDAGDASQMMQRLFDPDQLENNIALYAQLGMSVTDATAIMQGAGEIPEDMAGKMIDLSKRIAAMGPIAGKAYADAMGMSYKMAQQLAGLTRDQVNEVNKLFGRDQAELQEKALKEQRERQRESLKQQFEETKNRMALMWMEALQPILDLLKEGLKAFQGILESLKPTMKVIGKVIEALIVPLMAIIKPLGQIISQIAELFFGEDSPIMKQILNVVTIVGDIMYELLPIIVEIMAAVGEVAFDVIGEVMKVVADVLVALKPFFKSLAGFFRDVIGPIGEIITSLIKEMQPVFVMVADIAALVMEIFTDILSDILNAIMPPLKLIFKLIADIVTSLKGPIEDALESLKPAFKIIADVLKKVMGQIVSILANPAIKAAIKQIAEVASLLIGDLMITMANMIQKLVDGIDWAAMNDMLTQLSELLMKLIQKKLVDFIDKITDKMEKFGDSGAKTINIVVKLASKIMTLLDKFDVLKAKFKEALETVKTFFGTIKDKIVDFFNAIVGGFKWVGDKLQQLNIFSKDRKKRGEVDAFADYIAGGWGKRTEEEIRRANLEALGMGGGPPGAPPGEEEGEEEKKKMVEIDVGRTEEQQQLTDVAAASEDTMIAAVNASNRAADAQRELLSAIKDTRQLSEQTATATANMEQLLRAGITVELANMPA